MLPMPVPERPVLVAPDSFKGTFRAAAGGRGDRPRARARRADAARPVPGRRRRRGHAGRAAAAARRRAARRRRCRTRSAAPCRAGFGLVEDGGTAIVEMAAGQRARAGRRGRARRLGRVHLRHRRADRAPPPRPAPQVILVARRRLGHDRRRRGRARGDRRRRRPRRRADRRAVRRAHAVRGRRRRSSARRRAPTPTMVARLRERLDAARAPASRATRAACR